MTWTRSCSMALEDEMFTKLCLDAGSKHIDEMAAAHANDAVGAETLKQLRVEDLKLESSKQQSISSSPHAPRQPKCQENEAPVPFWRGLHAEFFNQLGSSERAKSNYFYPAGRPLLPKINIILPLGFGCDLQSQRGEVT